MALAVIGNIDSFFVALPHRFVDSVEPDGKHGDVVELRNVLYKVVDFFLDQVAGVGGAQTSAICKLKTRWPSWATCVN